MKKASLMAWAVEAAVLLISVGALAQPLYFTENFEQGSVFGPAPGYSRSTLSGVTDAPNTSPALHINQGGDLEFMYTEASATHVVALASGTYGDVRVDGYVGIGSASGAGGISGGLILRATSASNFYLAEINTNPGDPRYGDLFLGESVGGIISVTFADLSIPNFDPLHEDYHLIFQASGMSLSATLYREQVLGGVLAETLVGSVNGTDNALSAGEVGLYSFAVDSNNVFFDDIRVSAVPEPQVAALCGVGVAMWFSTRGKREVCHALRLSRVGVKVRIGKLFTKGITDL